MSPVRILYLGSRSWVDLISGLDLRQTQKRVRAERIVPPGRLGNAIRRRMQLDIAEHGRICVVNGFADGADILSHIIALESDQQSDPYPVELALDGQWPGAGPRRNARQNRVGKPIKARCFASGRRGEPVTPGSASMLNILALRDVPVIVHREDGIQ